MTIPSQSSRVMSARKLPDLSTFFCVESSMVSRVSFCTTKSMDSAEMIPFVVGLVGRNYVESRPNAGHMYSYNLL